jgi:hypothetical protein
MAKTKSISFDELRQHLRRLGYTEKHAENAHVFHRAHKDQLIFRRYRDDEPVAYRDLQTTRFFLDAWGLMDANDFDSFVDGVKTPA